MQYPLYLEETKEWLNGATFTELKLKYNRTNVNNRIYQTFNRLVRHFDFDKRGIEYPNTGRNYISERFSNAKKHKEFWLSVIVDYENGLSGDVYKLPPKDPQQDSRKISDLTVAEFTALMKSILSDQNK